MTRGFRRSSARRGHLPCLHLEVHDSLDAEKHRHVGGCTLTEEGEEHTARLSEAGLVFADDLRVMQRAELLFSLCHHHEVHRKLPFRGDDRFEGVEEGPLGPFLIDSAARHQDLSQRVVYNRAIECGNRPASGLHRLNVVHHVDGESRRRAGVVESPHSRMSRRRDELGLLESSFPRSSRSSSAIWRMPRFSALIEGCRTHRRRCSTCSARWASMWAYVSGCVPAYTPADAGSNRVVVAISTRGLVVSAGIVGADALGTETPKEAGGPTLAHASVKRTATEPNAGRTGDTRCIISHLCKAGIEHAFNQAAMI